MARAVVRSRRRGVSCVRGLVSRYICASDVRCVRVGCVCVKYISFRLDGKKHRARPARPVAPPTGADAESGDAPRAGPAGRARAAPCGPRPAPVPRRRKLHASTIIMRT
eukprot:scaffold92278_cov62-Phaeocystis_antarctica.AAC.15